MFYQRILFQIIFLACVFTPQAHAWESTEFEVNLMQFEGARINLVSRINPDETIQIPLSPTIELGVTENKATNKEYSTTESKAFFNAGIGIAAQLNINHELIQFSEFIIGADGLSLKDIQEKDAKHFITRGRVGLRIEDKRRFVTLGVGLQSRSIPNNQVILVNQKLLTSFIVTPSLGLGWIF